MKYLKFYRDCLGAGMLPIGGLCVCMPDKRSKRLLKRFLPEDSDFRAVNNWGYWAGPNSENSYDRALVFNDIRQNIVLFMAAMNNEL